MNILFSSASYIFSDHIPGGEYQVAHAIVSELARRGHEIHLLVPVVKLEKPIQRVTTHELGGFNFLDRESYFAYRWNWWTFTYRAFRKANEIVRDYTIDVVHHLRPAFPKKFSLCWKLKPPFVYGPVSLPSTASLSSENSETMAPGSGIWEGVKSRAVDRLNWTVGEHLWNRMLSEAAHIPVSVEKTLDYLPDICLEKASVVPLGVNPAEFYPSENASIELTILYAGNLIQAKGVAYLVRALSKIVETVPETRLRIAGDGPEKRNLQMLTESLRIEDNVEFLGAVPFPQMPGLFRQSSIFCLPTLAEAFGLGLLQAMASGIPVIASRVGGIPYFVEDGKSGYLVPSCDVDALVEKLLFLLQDPGKRAEMGAFNRQLVQSKYNWTHIVDRLEDIYKSVLENVPG